jgi:outer membrane protein TolC
VTLTGNLGSQASYISQLFSPGTGLWTTGGSVLQPIFDACTLYHNEVAARATFEQATSQYRSTAITAFQMPPTVSAHWPTTPSGCSYCSRCP